MGRTVACYQYGALLQAVSRLWRGPEFSPRIADPERVDVSATPPAIDRRAAS